MASHYVIKKQSQKVLNKLPRRNAVLISFSLVFNSYKQILVQALTGTVFFSFFSSFFPVSFFYYLSITIYTYLVTLYLITYYLPYFTFVFFFSHVQPSQSNLIFFLTTQLV